MTNIPYWHREFDTMETHGFNVYMRSTPTAHGTIIGAPPKLLPGETHSYPDGPLPSYNTVAPPEYSARRYSVIVEYPGSHFELHIISIAYMEDGWDTGKIDQPFEKYFDGQYQTLLTVPTSRTSDWMDDIQDWQGSTQELIARNLI